MRKKDSSRSIKLLQVTKQFLARAKKKQREILKKFGIELGDPEEVKAALAALPQEQIQNLARRAARRTGSLSQILLSNLFASAPPYQQK